MTHVNGKQVGGTHYARGGNLQHWDYAVRALGNRYLEGALTKYVMRHRHKGTPIQDLEKARHFGEKLLVEAQANRVKPLLRPADPTFSVHEMSVANSLNTLEDKIVKRIARWEFDGHIKLVIEYIDELLRDAREVERRQQAAKAGAGYVGAPLDS